MVPKGLLPNGIDPVVVGSGHFGRGKQKFARSLTLSIAGQDPRSDVKSSF
jgi:hypothetical protein